MRALPCHPRLWRIYIFRRRIYYQTMLSAIHRLVEFLHSRKVNSDTLTHFTSRAGLLGILENGFAIKPCDRLLIDHFFGTDRPFVGDAQNFGMVCFTEAPLDNAGVVRRKGDYALVLSRKWAISNRACKVEYLSAKAASKFRPRMLAAIKEVEAAMLFPGDDFWRLAYRNKEFAHSIGAKKYALLLDKYEYCQISDDAGQREWRITQKRPFYNLSSKELPSPEGWGKMMFFLPFTVEDVVCLACPAGAKDGLVEALPAHFAKTPIHILS